MDIFLVEDDKIYAEFICKALAQNPDYNISAYPTGEDALKAISEKIPEVIIIDYKLPGMLGIELYESIKLKITKANKVIMLSAMDDGNIVLSFLQKGIRDYVIKDENVIEALQAIIAGKNEYFFS